VSQGETKKSRNYFRFLQCDHKVEKMPSNMYNSIFLFMWFSFCDQPDDFMNAFLLGGLEG